SPGAPCPGVNVRDRARHHRSSRDSRAPAPRAANGAASDSDASAAAGWRGSRVALLIESVMVALRCSVRLVRLVPPDVQRRDGSSPGGTRGLLGEYSGSRPARGAGALRGHRRCARITHPTWLLARAAAGYTARVPKGDAHRGCERAPLSRPIAGIPLGATHSAADAGPPTPRHHPPMPAAFVIPPTA